MEKELEVDQITSVCCSAGHVYDISGFTDKRDEDIRASISWCVAEVAKDGGLISECGERIIWLHFRPGDREPKLVFTRNGKPRVMGTKEALDKLEE